MEIKCEFRNSSWTAATSRSVHYTCWINSASITDKFKLVKSFKGAHENGKANEDVEAIAFEDTQVEYFPRGLSKIFPHLKRFEIFNCGLKEICREDLIGLEELLTFGLPNNFLTTLPDDLFTNMTSLQVIYFNNNQIEFASSKLFAPFKENTPRFVILSANTSIDYRYIGKDENYGMKHMKWFSFMRLIDRNCKRAPSASSSSSSSEESCYNLDWLGIWGGFPGFPIAPIQSEYIPSPLLSKMARSSAKKTTSLIAEKPKNPPIIKGVEDLLDEFEKLRLSNCLTDFVIIVGSKELPVHKNVLATQSPTFKELFEQEKDAGKLIVSDSDLEAIEGFLDYLYTRKTPSSIESASRILKLAEKYKVEKLKSACEDAILARLDDTNLLEIFNIGHESCLENLIASAFHKIQDMFGGKIKDEFMNQPEAVGELMEAQSRLNALVVKFGE